MEFKKKCNDCGEIKPETEYSVVKYKDDKPQLKPYCKSCMCKRTKAYTEKNKEKVKQQRKLYYEAHKEVIVQRHKKYYELHKEEITKKSKQWKNDNRDRYNHRQKLYARMYLYCKPGLREYRNEYTKQYYRNNKDKCKQLQREWYLKNREILIEKSKQWNKDNPDKVKRYAEKAKNKHEEP